MKRRVVGTVATLALTYVAWRLLGYADVPFNQNEVWILLSVSALIVFFVSSLMARRN